MIRSALVLCLILVWSSSGFSTSRSNQQHQIKERDLVDAVEKGDRAKIILLLKQGANIDARWINHTPLSAAIFQQDVEMVRFLLARGAKVQSGDLADAAHGTQGDQGKALIIVKLLLSKGVNLKAEGAEALKSAGVANNLAVIKVLLARGADPNGKNVSGEPILLDVVSANSLESTEALLNAGAAVNAIGEGGENVFMRAARTDHRDDAAARVRLLALLIRHKADVNARDKSGRTALHWSLSQIMSEGGGFLSRPEVVRFVLDSGANVNAQDERGGTGLMEIVQAWRSPIELTQLLLDRGADVNLTDKEGATALMLAAQRGRADLAQLLLDKDAHLDARDNRGRTALVYAVEEGQPEMVALLSGKGANIEPYKNAAELQHALRGSRLLRAVTYRSVADVEKLLREGVSANTRNQQNRSALWIAASNYSDDIVKLLLANGADVNITDDVGNTPLMIASGGNASEVVSSLLAHEAAVNITNKDGRTALMFAAEDGHTQVAEQLLAKGADLHLRDAAGNTALLLASMSDYAQAELVELLLAKGAEVDVADAQGNTPLMLAADGAQFRVVETLLGAGASITAKNAKGFTALRLVRETKRSSEEARAFVIRTLLKAGAKE